MQTLWWLPNKILRHIHKKRFSRFLEPFPALLQSKCTKSAKEEKKIFYLKIQYGYQKTHIFTLISNPLKKFWKNAPKKVISKNVTEICTFFTFPYVRRTCFACNFFWVHFLQLFQQNRNQREILRFFDIFIFIFFKTIFWGHISMFCKLWSQMRKKRLKKSKNVFFGNVS